MVEIKKSQLKFTASKLKATLELEGIFGIPEEWKTTDEANPNLFTYVVRMAKFQIQKGKVQARQLTERQKRQAEQKGKKGGKKDPKAPTEPSEQEQRLRKQEQEKQKQKQEYFESLSEQQKVYHAAEDSFKSSSLKFPVSSAEFEFIGKDCLIFEERITQDKGDWIYIFKTPTSTQEELAKMRKSKPKTLPNINDLNPVAMRAWVDFSRLTADSASKQTQYIRCKVQQVNKTADSSSPNLEKTYIKVNLKLQEPIIKEKDQFNFSSLITDPPKAKEKSPQTIVIEQLKDELSIAIQSLAMQYSAMFWKDINMQEEQRNAQVFLSKKGQTIKRKEQFLYDFNVTGKYKVFKDRIKKCIVHICQTKYKHLFTGMKSFNGVKCNSQDQIYSEIYDLLVSTYQNTNLKMTKQKQHELNQVLVINKEVANARTEKILNTFINESLGERIARIVKQHDLIEDHEYGQVIMKKYIQAHPQSSQLKYQYGMYCLKYNLRPPTQILPFIDDYMTKQKHDLPESNKIQYMYMLLNAGGNGLVKGWIILRELIDKALISKDQALPKWLLLADVTLTQIGQTELAQKYRSLTQRVFSNISEPVQAQAQKQEEQQSNKEQIEQKQKQAHIAHRQNPKQTQIPSLSGVSSYALSENKQKTESNFNLLVQELCSYAAFDLIEKTQKAQSLSVVQQGKKQQAQNAKNQEKEVEEVALSLNEITPRIMRLFVMPGQEAIQQAYDLAKKQFSSIRQNSHEKIQYLEFIIRSLLLSLKYKTGEDKINALTESQTYLKKSLSLNSSDQKRFQTLLRLGYVYCQKSEFGNARACLLKYLQKMKSTYTDYSSGVSFKLIGKQQSNFILLGIANLNSQRIEEAIESFKFWNLCDNKDPQVWLYLALSYSKQGKIVSVNQCLNQYVPGSSKTEQQIMLKLRKQIENKKSVSDHYENSMCQKVLECVK